jgi:hypothetical protein
MAEEEKKVATEKPYYGTLKKRPVYGGGLGLQRYRQPFNFELAGRSFKLVMDHDDDYTVHFTDGHYLEWGCFGEAGHSYYYECNKADETTYFVNFELEGSTPRKGYTLVLDLEQRLATLVKSRTRFHKRYPNLVDSDFDFGAIELEGYPLPRRRHAYSADLVGKRIRWTYSPEFAIIHVYYHAHYVRGTFPPETVDFALPTQEAKDMWALNVYDEKSTCIKIKKNMYVVELIEQNMAKAGATGNSLLFLMDTARVHDVGRSFGYAVDPEKPGVISPENYLFSAYGDFVESDGVIEKARSIYRAG